MKFTFTNILWLYPGEGSWHFLSMPKDVSETIKMIEHDRRISFGSVRVKATIGGSTWYTSIFPDSKAGIYLLPVKKPVRQSERIEEGSKVEATIEID